MALAMQGAFRKVSERFWTPVVWLPPNVTWNDLKSTEEVRYATTSDIYLPILYSFVLIFIRAIVERFIFCPIAVAFGLKAQVKRSSLPDNPALEKAYLSSRKGKVSKKEMQGLLKQVDMTERQIERWMRLRVSQDRPSKMVKFTETAWRMLFYTVAFVYGLYSLWDKPWFSNIQHCWIGYPFEHTLTDDIWCYYMLELSFYWALTLQHFQNVRRKDFWEMLVHHLATICLLVFSLVVNFTRVGTLVLVIHDVADIFLEGAKLMRYIRYTKACDIFFAIFTLIWIVSRLGYFPFWIIRSSLFEAYTFIPFFPAYYIFNGLLCTLLLLHVIWTYYILRILWKVFNGSETSDSRSSTSELSGDEIKTNGTTSTPDRRRKAVRS
ncbi:ceramide synthase 6-like isoform X2 [Artemia franciscana]|uniref:TLC domain-containing protein n=1 Tax=Artemia franciscana TaxID=6661 RepID=A0AA88HJY5_ARTSF|nr:hypothetical protein QYM36_016332 [Artemia franciscana]KAK2706252.1 hypothetical protein QYM36_016332 [Artemia franciscana]